MNTNDKTLADVQPGGRVRLGDSRSTRAATFLRQYLTYLRSSPRQGLRPRWCDVYEALEVAIEALAARQPVGEPAMYQVRPRRFPAGEGWREVSKREFDDRGDFPGYPEAEWERRTLYAAPPAQQSAQAVDLGQFRALAEFGEEFAFSAEKQPQSRVVYAQARRLLALIDGKAVGK